MPATMIKPAIPDQEIKEQGRTWIYGIEIFATGPHNWEKYRHEWTRDELQEMAEAFEPTLEELSPNVITNHGKSQPVPVTDGEGINRGFVGRIYFRDDKLFADMLVDNDLVADLRAARYRRPSVELFEDYELRSGPRAGEVFPWVVSTVSIQGGRHIEAVRTLEPIHRTLAAQHHFAHGGRSIVVTFDQEVSTMDPEMKAMCEKLIAGQEAILAALPKAPMPAEMSKKPEDEQPKMGEAGAGAPAPAPAAAPAAAPATPPAAATAALSPEKREPSQVVLKYEQDLKSANDRIAQLERDNAIAKRAAELERDRGGVKSQLMKFAQGEAPRIPPALIEPLADALVLLPEGGKRLKFAQADGSEKEGTARDLVLSVLERIPAVPLKADGKNGARPPSSPKRLAFEESVAQKAQAEGKPAALVFERELAQLPPDEFRDTFGAMVFPDMRDE